MEHEPGDDYIRRIATFIRTNEQGLAAAGNTARRRTKAPEPSVFNPLGWFDTTTPANIKPVILSFDVHHLYYLLMRMEALELDVGSLDVKVENLSRPMNYISIPGSDRSDALSMRSFTSTLTAVSRLSLGGGWWGKPAPLSVDVELKYIFSSFTKLPALRLHAPESRLIVELANEPLDRALPLYVFRNLQILECTDIDPHGIIGWDRLAESLRSLTVKRGGLEDVSDLFIKSVLEDQARREGRTSIPRTRGRRPPSRQGSWHATRLPDSVPEDAEESSELPSDPALEKTPTPTETKLPSLKWASLRYLCLADNALTFIPTTPLLYLVSVSHLDISSNLLVSVPSGLSTLYNLISLNLSDNMIDSVLGIYTMLGQVLILNLARNRLESICGLERLMALERVDLRHNLIEESAEVGRLATLPNIAEVWVEGNPLTEIEEGYRIRCFDIFWKEGKTISLDGTPPGFYEKRYLTELPSEQMSSTRAPQPTAPSPPVVPVGSTSPVTSALVVPPKEGSPGLTPSPTVVPSQGTSPQLAAVRGRKKRNKRIVDLDGSSESGASRSASHVRASSDVGINRRTASPMKVARTAAANLPEDSQPVAGPSVPKAVLQTKLAVVHPVPGSAPTQTSPVPPSKFASRHPRRQTEFSPGTSPRSPTSGGMASADGTDLSTSPPPGDKRIAAHRRSSTMSSKSATRRARVSASMYEPPTPGGEKDGVGQFSEAEAFRARIEALRSDMGDGWLKVFNQSHMGSASPSPSASVASG